MSKYNIFSRAIVAEVLYFIYSWAILFSIIIIIRSICANKNANRNKNVNYNNWFKSAIQGLKKGFMKLIK